MSDTTSMACKNWVHRTYELIGCQLRGSVTRVTKVCLVKHLGGKNLPSYFGGANPEDLLREMEDEWKNNIEIRGMLNSKFFGTAMRWWVMHCDSLLEWREVRITFSIRLSQSNSPTTIQYYHGKKPSSSHV